MTCKPNALQRLFHRLLMLEAVSRFMSRYLHRADALMLRLTAARHTFTELAGLPMIQLDMTGAKTGTPRTLTLIAVPDDGRLVLFATNFGRKHNPAWYYNLKAHPECQVRWNGRSGMFTAREASGEEYGRYWQIGVSYYQGYEVYKVRASHRHIPVMVLEPKK